MTPTFWVSRILPEIEQKVKPDQVWARTMASRLNEREHLSQSGVKECNGLLIRKSRQAFQRRTIIPCRLVVRARYCFSSSLSEEQSLPSSYPHTSPPQSSLTLAPDLVMPYLLQVHALVDEDLDDALVDDGDEEALLREDVSEGTSLSESLSLSLSDSSRAFPSRLARRSTEEALYCSRVIVRVSCGRLGRGHLICEGDKERPLGICSLVRRVCLLLECDFEDGAGATAGPGDFPDGMSRMLSLRPVVGSVVDSRAGS